MKKIQEATDRKTDKFFVVLNPKGTPVAKFNFMTLAQSKEYEEWLRSETVRIRQRYQQKIEEDLTN